MSWDDFQRQQGAILAPDGIAMNYGDLKAEYHAALEQAVIMDRSHEGRFEAHGRSRFELIQRISTNDVLNMSVGEGRPTIFTNPNGRILDRIVMYNRGDTACITSEPGRGQAVRAYLQRQIFFNDDFQLHDLTTNTKQFTLNGPQVNRIIDPPKHEEGTLHSFATTLAGHNVLFLERKPMIGTQWAAIVPNEGAEAVWTALLDAGKGVGLKAAGSLTHNTLRIRAGRPAAGRELSPDYIPLEAGLWDEVSFSKGCYTGQEIIARMESRSRLAKTLVKFELSEMIEAPAPLYHDGKAVVTLTSSVTTPDGAMLGLGFVKLALATEGETLSVGDAHIRVSISELAGAQPPKEFVG